MNYMQNKKVRTVVCLESLAPTQSIVAFGEIYNKCPNTRGGKAEAFTKDVVYQLLGIARRLVTYRKHTATGLLRSTFLSPSRVLTTCSVSCAWQLKIIIGLLIISNAFFRRVQICRQIFDPLVYQKKMHNFLWAGPKVWNMCQNFQKKFQTAKIETAFFDFSKKVMTILFSSRSSMNRISLSQSYAQ